MNADPLRPRRSPLAFSVTLLAFALLLAGSRGAPAATITVTGTGDVVAQDGVVTLREAITSANNDASVNLDVVAVGTYGADVVEFNIPGAGPHVISLLSQLPAIIDTLSIDGYSQSGASANTNAFGQPSNAVIDIVLDGTSAGAVDGLALSNHSGSVVRGLAIGNFAGNGVLISGTGGGHRVAGCFIGTNAAGTAAAGNGQNGVLVFGVAGNFIGGDDPADRNVLSKNSQAGIFGGVEIREVGATGNLVQGNYIGTDKTGALALGNAQYGAILQQGASSNTIGGSAPGTGNVISGNGAGITIQCSPSAGDRCLGNVIAGNRIGTNAAGTAALANTFGGIGTVAYADDTVIGGTTAGAGNLVSGNSTSGISLGGSDQRRTLVQGNLIGTDVTGAAPLPNSTDGVVIADGDGSAIIGGTAAGAANVIAFNGAMGVHVRKQMPTFPDPEGFAVLGNSIHDNGGLGIGLAEDGVTPNDAGDPDLGPNLLQNFPVISLATSNGVSTSVTGTLNSTASTTFRIEFFASPGCDGSGNGEGTTFLGAISVATDGSGNAAFSPLFAAGSIGTLTSTATDPGNNTSEFSQCTAIGILANNAPIAAGDSYPTSGPLAIAAPGVLANDSDPDGDAITAVLDLTTTNGTLVLNPDGSFTYTPNGGFVGTDTFTYHATDGALNSNVVTVQIVVAPLIPTLDWAGLVVFLAALAAAAVTVLRKH